MHVIVVGAGPSGLVLSLQLAKAGIQVTLLDAADKIDERPRAAHYAPSAVRELRRAGVLDDVRKEGLVPGDIYWRKLDVLPLGHLDTVLLEHTKRFPNLDVRWNHPVRTVEQDKKSVTAIIGLADGSEMRITADYLCGCDGAKSAVRKSLFGNKFEGKTWETQIIATNVYYPIDQWYGEINFIMHPDHFFMAAKITNDGMWRVSYGEPVDMPWDEVLKNQPKKYEIMLPGSPKQGDYELASIYPYRIHQRCAERFRVGRVCLAADAAHLCNPFGGMGLTGGLVDVGGLSQCLIGIMDGKVDDGVLDKYDEVRRQIWKTVIDPVSSGNFVRVSSDPDIVADTDAVIVNARAAHQDPAMKQKQDDFAYAICHDFTQYFHQKSKKACTLM
ncbi:hypothetical protein B7494_g8191 [Chlorociboria aeruginascens]|nr:hypothetical protein B7494_g8191 [Chlorociboria aeruginascens]